MAVIGLIGIRGVNHRDCCVCVVNDLEVIIHYFVGLLLGTLILVGRMQRLEVGHFIDVVGLDSAVGDKVPPQEVIIQPRVLVGMKRDDRSRSSRDIQRVFRCVSLSSASRGKR